ncbi:MAG TPA: helix-turn-helix domain-containing protein [Anaeromyxobacteraceae bacterium]|nr:helix-turn-helix domain-containing protein [Anaeromyxobacteraceae bacterium]
MRAEPGFEATRMVPPDGSHVPRWAIRGEGYRKPARAERLCRGGATGSRPSGSRDHPLRAGRGEAGWTSGRPPASRTPVTAHSPITERGEKGKGPGSFANREANRALGVARGTGFEPVASGSGGAVSPLVTSGDPSQPLVIARGRRRGDCSPSLDLAPFSRPRVTPELQAQRAIGPHERLLTVREVAARLQVSTATVYRLCGEGKLPHVRVSNSIRISPGEVPGFAAGPLD